MIKSKKGIEGWKRSLLRSEKGKIEIAGVFAKTYGPLINNIICHCEHPKCWCGFSAHVEIKGALKYKPLDQPIAHVSLTGAIKLTGGRGKGYIVATRQEVLDILWPNWCTEKGCEAKASGLAINNSTNICARCQIHGEIISIEDFYEIHGVKVSWLPNEYRRWVKIQG
jgi:hypothetical protein